MSQKLTHDQIERAYNWLKKKWTNNPRKCDICGKKDWCFSAKLLRVLNDKNINLSEKVNITSFFAILCINCGNTKFFEAQVLHLIDDEITKDETNAVETLKH